jgi:hypothetical protein
MIRKLTLALFLIVFAAGAALAQTNEQVPFTATGTATITGVTKMPGGLIQVNHNTSGTATHLGDFSGPLVRIQDHHGTFGSTAVIVAANGKDSVFFSVSGRFETTKDKCVATSTGTYIVTGGGGAFLNATGSGKITTEMDLCAGTAKGTYTGTISKPKSN